MSGRVLKILILTSCAILFLTANSCWLIKSSIGLPAYDVMKPGPEVGIIAINKDSTVVVTSEFMVWVTMLKQEVERLRAKIGEDW